MDAHVIGAQAHGTLDPAKLPSTLDDSRNHHVIILPLVPQTVTHTDDGKYASPAEQNRLLAAVDADYPSADYRVARWLLPARLLLEMPIMVVSMSADQVYGQAHGLFHPQPGGLHQVHHDNDGTTAGPAQSCSDGSLGAYQDANLTPDTHAITSAQRAASRPCRCQFISAVRVPGGKMIDSTCCKLTFSPSHHSSTSCKLPHCRLAGN